MVTLGARGCVYFTPGGGGRVPGFAVTPVDTTGAGDGFVAGMLAGLLDHDLSWDQATIQNFCGFENIETLATSN